MGRGLGYVQTKLLELFRADPRAIRTTSELCLAVYGEGDVLKKHRVAVLRALRNLDARNQIPLARRFEQRDDVWFRRDIWPGVVP